jgi:putative nucleotidyltransferase with HDIG domain
VIGQDDLRLELQRLQEELSEQRRLAAEKERQLERYAADLRETFKAERARAEELRRSYVATVRALTNSVEARDAYTGKHAERVAAYGLELARRIDPELASNAQVEFGFLLHDVGKVAIPDGILHKPEPLADAERQLMRRHPVIGWEILSTVPFLEEASEIVRAHHEHYDGSGYPDGLAGEQIPIEARIVTCCDAFSAMTTTRSYRKAMTVEDAVAELRACAGTQFDPKVADALIAATLG